MVKSESRLHCYKFAPNYNYQNTWFAMEHPNFHLYHVVLVKSKALTFMNVNHMIICLVRAPPRTPWMSGSKAPSLPPCHFDCALRSCGMYLLSGTWESCHRRSARKQKLGGGRGWKPPHYGVTTGPLQSTSVLSYRCISTLGFCLHSMMLSTGRHSTRVVTNVFYRIKEKHSF